MVGWNVTIYEAIIYDLKVTTLIMRDFYYKMLKDIKRLLKIEEGG